MEEAAPAPKKQPPLEAPKLDDSACGENSSETCIQTRCRIQTARVRVMLVGNIAVFMTQHSHSSSAETNADNSTVDTCSGNESFTPNPCKSNYHL